MSRNSTSQSGLEKAARAIRQLENISQLINKFPQKFLNTDYKQGSIKTVQGRINEAKAELLKALHENNITLIEEGDKRFLELTESNHDNWKQTRIII